MLWIPVQPLPPTEPWGPDRKLENDSSQALPVKGSRTVKEETTRIGVNDDQRPKPDFDIKIMTSNYFLCLSV